MELINNNPYRIAGILSNATAKEFEKQKAKIKAFARVGKEIKSDYDFQILENIYRTENSIDKAFSNIEQNQDKVHFALFWFLNANPFDDTAIEYLKNGADSKAIEIWEKVTQNKEVNTKNFSAFNNLGTYKLLSSNQDIIKEGIEAKVKLIESDYFENFVHTVADATFTIDNQKQTENFIDALLANFKSDFSSSELLTLFNNCNESTQKYLSKKFTEEPIHNIESKIESTKNKRKEDKGGAYEFGLKLYTNCKGDLLLLKSLLGESNLKYKAIADQLANEIMQCGIDYFNTWKSTKDPSEDGLKLLQFAKSIVVGKQAMDRIDSNLKGIQEWAKTASSKKELQLITKELADLKSWKPSIAVAKKLIVNCKPSLETMGIKLGNTNDLYLKISGSIVNNALGMIILQINEATELLNKFENNHSIYNTESPMKEIFKEALNVSYLIGTLDMDVELKLHYNKNHNILESLAAKFNINSSKNSSDKFIKLTEISFKNILEESESLILPIIIPTALIGAGIGSYIDESGWLGAFSLSLITIVSSIIFIYSLENIGKIKQYILKGISVLIVLLFTFLMWGIEGTGYYIASIIGIIVFGKLAEMGAFSKRY